MPAVSDAGRPYRLRRFAKSQRQQSSVDPARGPFVDTAYGFGW